MDRYKWWPTLWLHIFFQESRFPARKPSEKTEKSIPPRLLPPRFTVPAKVKPFQMIAEDVRKTTVKAPEREEKCTMEVQTSQLREKQILRELIDDKDVLQIISTKQPCLMKEILGIITQRF